MFHLKIYQISIQILPLWLKAFICKQQISANVASYFVLYHGALCLFILCFIVTCNTFISLFSNVYFLFLIIQKQPEILSFLFVTHMIDLYVFIEIRMVKYTNVFNISISYKKNCESKLNKPIVIKNVKYITSIQLLF